jgi:hypothetical protein
MYAIVAVGNFFWRLCNIEIRMLPSETVFFVSGEVVAIEQYAYILGQRPSCCGDERGKIEISTNFLREC